MTRLASVFGIAVLTASAFAQAPSPPAPATPEPTPVSSPEYRVGAGDILDIAVFGNDDLSRTAIIQTNGAIAFPLLGEVEIAGLTVEEVKTKLTRLLARDLLVNPQVEVKVRDYQSQSVLVVGEVNNPGRKPLRGHTRLIDALVDAGGFTPRASGEVVIARNDGGFDGGGKSLRLRLGGASLTPKDQVNLEVPLRNGDIVSALPKYFITVEGEVSRPGRYPLDGDLTVSGAISVAGGLTRFGSSQVKLRRTNPDNSSVTILKVDLKAIRSGKAKDLPMLPNDVVSVGRRLF